MTDSPTQLTLDALDIRRDSSRSADAADQVTMVEMEASASLDQDLGSGSDPDQAQDARDVEARIILDSGLFDAAWYARVNHLPETVDPLEHYRLAGWRQGLNPSAAFHIRAYLAANPDVREADAEPLLHYIRMGRDEGRLLPSQDHDAELIRASGLFDESWYVGAYGLADDVDPLNDYLNVGWRGGRSPSPAFDTVLYLEANPDIREAAIEPLLHYIRRGREEGRPLKPKSAEMDAVSPGGADIELEPLARARPDETARMQQLDGPTDVDAGPDGDAPSVQGVDTAVEEIQESGLFDAVWYAAQNDLPEHVDPLEHYQMTGWREGRSPSPGFPIKAYLRANPDIRAAGIEPLLHYIRQGREEGRPLSDDDPDSDLMEASGLFDSAWYAAQNGLGGEVDPLAHYRTIGWTEGRNPSAAFNLKAYFETNPDVLAARVEPLLHYLRQGRAEGRRLSRADNETQAILEAGLFDADWYSKRISVPDGMDPLEHYRTVGWRLGHDPGPFFSVSAYLKENKDVRAADAEPLGHFSLERRTTGRMVGRPSPGKQAADARVNLGLLCSDPPEELRVVVVVHAFYIDVFEQTLCPLLANIPGQFTLCVAVSEAVHVPRVEAAFDKLDLNGRLICRVGQNRGRNFGTMLAEFSDEIEWYDVVLHLHTKRSLYSGREQNEWRQSLYSALASSRALVCGILNLFDQDPDVGLVYPKIFDGLPYWAHHWLSNGHIGPQLLHRLGVEDIPDGYFDFPVGGMFWARVDALRPLLEARLTYEDFPPEDGQTDGTTAHAIERAIGVLAADRNYNFVEVEYETGLLRANWSDRNLTQYQHRSLEEFEGLLEDIDLVSFDIFDTLVVRPARKPDAIIRYVGQRMESDLPANAFFILRKQAESRARQAKHYVGDVDIHEIYAAFPVQDGWTEALIAKAKGIELELDLKVVRTRPQALEMVRAARGRKLRVIAISDTYLPVAQVAAILEKCGFSDLIDHLYVSSHEQARKDTGALWDKVAALEGVDPGRWLHVGDNEHSDIQAACDRRLKFFHVMNPTVLNRLQGFNPSTEKAETAWASDLVVGPAILRLAGDPFLNGRSFRTADIRSAEDVGYVVFGPIVFAFLAWIIAHPALRGVERLCFLSREGLVLQNAYEAIRERCPNLSLPPSLYLLTSRRAALGASQAVQFTPERLSSASGGFKGTFGDLLKNRLGLSMEADALGAWPIRLPQDSYDVTFALETLEEEIVAHAGPELDHYRRYLDGAGVVDDQVLGLVDVGYSGTIQKSLQDIIDATFVGFYMATAPAAAEVEDGGGFAFGCFSSELNHEDSSAPVMRHSLAMEAFLTAPHGQVTCFGPEGAQMKAIPQEDPSVAMLNGLHAGAIDYCIELIDIYGPDLLRAPCATGRVQEFLRMFCAGQLKADTEILSALQVEDEYCGNPKLSPFDLREEKEEEEDVKRTHRRRRKTRPIRS